MHTNPRRIFSLPEQPETWIEVDPDRTWEVRAADLRTRAGWTPFEGRQLRGKVTQVVLRGQPAFDGEQVRAGPGSGKDLAGRVAEQQG
jgi:carbamoyl-phosphate synthase/aspartate carbamoyltransferase/dihydroorotase